MFWLPAFVVYTIYDIYPPCIQSPTLFLIVKALHLANWMINPFVYSFRMPIFKDTLVVWSLGLAAFTLMMLSIYITQTPVFYFFQSLITFLSLSSLLLVCASYLAIRTRLRFTPPGIESHNSQSTERNLRLSRTFFIVAALSLLFWLTAFVVYTIRDLCSPCIRPTGWLIGTVLHLANSLINPFVYSFWMPIFKDTLRSCWRRRRPNIKIRPVEAHWLIWGGGRSFSHCFEVRQKNCGWNFLWKCAMTAMKVAFI